MSSTRILIVTAVVGAVYVGSYLALRWQHALVHYAWEDYPVDAKGSCIWITRPDGTETVLRTVRHGIDAGGLWEQPKRDATDDVVYACFLPLGFLESAWHRMCDDDRTAFLGQALRED